VVAGGFNNDCVAHGAYLTSSSQTGGLNVRKSPFLEVTDIGKTPTCCHHRKRNSDEICDGAYCRASATDEFK
jgi:hypothetical protein